jgi:hypothetical protein
MDVKGARILTERIAERQWRLAEGVRLGKQPAEDPDAAYLEEIGDWVRLYSFPANGSGGPPRRVKKVLSDGCWRVEELDGSRPH